MRLIAKQSAIQTTIWIAEKNRYSDYGHDLNTGYLNDSVIQKAGTIQTLNVNNDCCSVFMREPYPVQNKPH